MRRDIVIGVDGGDSKTRVVSQTILGETIGQVVGAGSNISKDVDQAYQTILALINASLKPAKLSLADKDVSFHIGLGLAGIEAPGARDAFLAKDLPAQTMLLKSGGYISCLGAHGGDNGAVISVGAGVVAYQIYQNEVHRIGGWGFPHSNEGGGAWLGLEAVRLTLQWRDGVVRSSPLVAAIFDHFDQDLDALVSWANQARAQDFAELAPYVILQLQHEDSNAEKLLKSCGCYLNGIASALQRQLPRDVRLPLCLVGGLSKFVEPFVSESLLQRIEVPKQNAVYGALLMVRRHLLEQAGEKGGGQ